MPKTVLPPRRQIRATFDKLSEKTLRIITSDRTLEKRYRVAARDVLIGRGCAFEPLSTKELKEGVNEA